MTDGIALKRGGGVNLARGHYSLLHQYSPHPRHLSMMEVIMESMAKYPATCNTLFERIYIYSALGLFC